ncbi:MAG: hypothetical protein H6618_01505 [Deltaproteobacteria bacterium]|nr:hypothetical protein [Deltaproteobacteria bacterium]
MSLFIRKEGGMKQGRMMAVYISADDSADLTHGSEDHDQIQTNGTFRMEDTILSVLSSDVRLHRKL